MATVVWATTQQPVKIDDLVIYNNIAYYVYLISTSHGHAAVTLNPDEGGHPVTYPPTALGMIVIED